MRAPPILGQVTDNRRMSDAGQRSSELCQLLGLPRTKNERSSAGRKRLGNRPTQASGRASEKGPPAMKIHVWKLPQAGY
jgi:hypothetical protein